MKVIHLSAAAMIALAATVATAQIDKPQQESTAKHAETTAPPVQEADGDGAPAVAASKGKLKLVDQDAPILKEVPELTEERPMDFWMQHKLEYSKKMLEAMTLGDYEKVRFNAQQMRLLGRIEGFVRRANPAYTAQSKAFDNSLTELMQGGDKKDSKQITAAFGKMTTSCVRCHSVLRGEAE
jgi:cytochrome c553